MEGGTFDNLTLQSCFMCYICGDYFKRPRILPCGHTFCSECLSKMREEIVKDGKVDTDQLSKIETIPTNLDNGTCNKSLSSSDIVIKNGSAACQPNGTSHDVSEKPIIGERKPSSSCMDDVDNVLQKSLHTPSKYATGQWSGLSMSSSATYTCLVDSDNIVSHQKSSRNLTPRKTTQSKNPIERCPSIVTNSSSKSKQCTKCGNIMPQRNASTSPIRRSTSMTSTRDQSPACLRDPPRWDNSSPHRRSTSHLNAPACSFEHKHGREMEPFVCPIPQCNYSMRVMNMARWSPRNRALANALYAWQRQNTKTQECGTQTDISNSQSVLVTFPRNLVVDPSASSVFSYSGRKRHSSMIDIAIDRAVTLDGPLPQPSYLPRGHCTWKSYAAMVGMNILQQMINL